MYMLDCFGDVGNLACEEFETRESGIAVDQPSLPETFLSLLRSTVTFTRETPQEKGLHAWALA